MELKRVGVASCARVGALMYGAMGLVYFPIIAIVAILETPPDFDQSLTLVYTLTFAVIVVAGSGLFGALISAVTAWLYNVIAGRFGGVELEIDENIHPRP